MKDHARAIAKISPREGARRAACAESKTPTAATGVETSLNARRNAKNSYNANNAPEPKKRPDGRVVRQPFNGEAHLYEVIQVRLSRTQRLVEVNTNGIRLAANTPVLIRFHRNMLMATTVGCRYRRVAEINALPFVVRIANDDDQRIDIENGDTSRPTSAMIFAISGTASSSCCPI